MHDIFIFLVFTLFATVALTLIGTHHARKMAEIAKRGNESGSDARVATLESELSELRQIVAEQAIALDDVSSMHRRLLDKAISDAGIRERLEAK